MNIIDAATTAPVVPVEPKTDPSPQIQPAQPFVTPTEPIVQPCPRLPDGDEGFPKCQFGERLREHVR